MVGHDQLPHLLSLLDDDSPVVQRALAEQFAEFGDDLGETLAALPEPPTEAQKRRIRTLLAEHHRERLRGTWDSWMERDTDTEKLEAALAMLSRYLDGGLRTTSLGSMLDSLAGEYRERATHPDARELAGFLFQERGMGGEELNYYHPENSDLARVVETGRGIPISLACVYILVGRRLGLDISGCNFPGHFLARVRAHDGEFFVDCFHQGRFLDRATLLKANPQVAPTLENILENEIYSDTIVIRVLNNLARAFEKQGSEPDRELMMELCHRVESYDRLPRVPEGAVFAADPRPPMFAVGELVRHRRYGYRGVVVSRDKTCQADDAWYEKNATRPDRNQAWYSVLVHGSDQVTYAAESSLVADDSTDPISHPLIDEFFIALEDGRYERNDRPWPGW